LEDHFADCPACARVARNERQVDEHLRTAMSAILVPNDLPTRLLAHLAAQRAAWYRGWPGRHPAWACLVAAALLLMVGSGIYWFFRAKPSIDLDIVLNDANEQLGASAQQVQQWFQGRGIRAEVPQEFNYAYVVSYAEESLYGRRVPRLLFVRGQNQAYIYIVSTSQFDLRTALQQLRAGSGDYTVELREHPENRKVAYLIIYTGGSLEWLETQRRSAT
jgi:hypothetical protein